MPDVHDNTNDRLLLTAKEAAALLGVNRRTLWRWTRPRGDIPCVRTGRLYRYSRETLEQWIADQEAVHGAESSG